MDEMLLMHRQHGIGYLLGQGQTLLQGWLVALLVEIFIQGAICSELHDGGGYEPVVSEPIEGSDIWVLSELTHYICFGPVWINVLFLQSHRDISWHPHAPVHNSTGTTSKWISILNLILRNLISNKLDAKLTLLEGKEENNNHF